MDELKNILIKEGYAVTEGRENVEKAIKQMANNDTKKLCSGFKVFPDGKKCSGCKDCA